MALIVSCTGWNSWMGWVITFFWSAWIIIIVVILLMWLAGRC